MYRTLLISALTLAGAAIAAAQSDIDATNKYAWTENAGWTNWRDAGSPPGSQGMVVHAEFLSGFVWAENAGWINLGDGSPADGTVYANTTGADFGVNLDAGTGNLSGLAWGENIGWINFAAGAMASPIQPARLRCDGRLDGFAWSENIGWINLAITQASKFVALSPAARPIACDMNHDGVSAGDDIQIFLNLMMNGGAGWRDICSGDLDAAHDGTLTPADVSAFVNCLLAG